MGSEGEDTESPLITSAGDPEDPFKRTEHTIFFKGHSQLKSLSLLANFLQKPERSRLQGHNLIPNNRMPPIFLLIGYNSCSSSSKRIYTIVLKAKPQIVHSVHEAGKQLGLLNDAVWTTWTAMAHIITGVIGAGVLSLAWSTAQLGWVAGPLTIVVFAATTIFSTNLLCDCYRSPDPECGPGRNQSYMQAVQFYLGEKRRRICGVFVQESLYGGGIAYTITSAVSARAIQKSNCYHRKGHEASCEYGDTIYMLLFGAVQIVVSQIPDFHNMAWLSIVATTMSFSYSFIGLGLGIAKVIENGEIKGSIGGVSADSIADKLWLVFQALGDIAFSFPFPLILLEIQDTLKSPPPENQNMKKGSTGAIFIATFFYLCCGSFGYAAFGSDTPGNLLTGFGFYEPYWLIDFANACIIVHLVGGYQVYSQPLFAFGERWFSEKFPNSGFVNNFYPFKLPLVPVFQLNPFRLCFRTCYVISTTVIAMIFPYFNQVLGVLGALNYWPLAIYFPMEMYFVQKKIGAWTTKWILYQTVSIVCLLVSVVALIGSIEGLVVAKLS